LGEDGLVCGEAGVSRAKLCKQFVHPGFGESLAELDSRIAASAILRMRMEIRRQVPAYTHKVHRRAQKIFGFDWVSRQIPDQEPELVCPSSRQRFRMFQTDLAA
jgi:hypothetical protein